jgi:N-methylhydantoinase A
VPASIAVDVGGTFTDLIYRDDEDGGRVVLAKAPTTPVAPDQAVLGVLDRALERDDLASAGYFLHGTTVGLNALLEGRGAVVGLLATRGFRDVLEIRRGDRDDPYDLFWHPPSPIVPRHLRLPVTGRIRADGTVHEPLDPEDVRSAVMTLQEARVTAIAVAFINAYANPKHELEAEHVLRAAGFTGHISLSHRVSGEYREYERTCTTVIDAFVRGRMNSYLARLEAGLRERGFAGQCFIMRSGGGAMTFAEAADRSVETILSGPVAGARAVAELARELELEHAVAADVGGTSFDTCLIDHGRPPVQYQGNVVGLPLQTPWIDVRSIGAGGGSIAYVDAGRLLRVGPRSAGAEPGPACYGRGGADPTVTDAAVVLGLLPASEISGGVSLSGELAEQVFDGLASELGFSTAVEAARGVMQIVAAQMGDAIRSVTVERGRDPRDASLVAFGGAGPLFATLMADELGVRSVIVPAYAGNFSAWGLLSAELARTASRTYLTSLSDAGLRAAGDLADVLFEQIGDQAANGKAHRAVQLDMRFAGQEHTLTVSTPMLGGRVDDDSDALAETFLHEYQRTFGSTIDEALEIVCVRAIVTVGDPGASRAEPALASHAGAAMNGQPMHDAWSFTEDRHLPFRLLERATLSAGASLEGPAIILEETATTYVDAGYVVNVHDTGALILTRNGRS